MKRQAFSLVELSIVLVILGLLTGGILSGQSLIRAAEMRSYITDIQRYSAAVNTFKDKYFAYPGDMANATSFWTSLGGTGSDATCQNISATGTATCNGNGDGVITTSVVTGDENLRFWQHLANAGLVEGSYTGVFPPGYSPGINVPRSKVGKGSFWGVAHYTSSWGGNASSFAQPAGTQLFIRNPSSLYIFKPEELWNVDTKLDDGKPGTGKVIGNKGDATYPCSTAFGVVAPGDAGAEYNLSNSGTICWSIVFNMF